LTDRGTDIGIAFHQVIALEYARREVLGELGEILRNKSQIEDSESFADKQKR
jgi:hypothetical protein